MVEATPNVVETMPALLQIAPDLADLPRNKSEGDGLQRL